MRKVIKYKDLKTVDLIHIVSALRKINLSDSESAMMSLLIKYSTNNSLTLDVHLARQIREELGMGESLYGTCISRLTQKKCIRKEGKVVMLSPFYHNILSWKEVVIRIDSSPD